MGLLTLRGALGGLESLPHWPCLLTLECQPRPFSKEACTRHSFPQICCQYIEGSLPCFSFCWCLAAQEHHMGAKEGKTKPQDAQTLSELVFRLQKCSEMTADPTPFPKCPTGEPSRRPSLAFLLTPAIVLSVHYTGQYFKSTHSIRQGFTHSQR